MKKDQRYYATVTVKFEMEVESGPWGKDTTVDQMHRDVLSAAGNQAARVVEACAKVTPGIRLQFSGTEDPVIRVEKP